MQPENVALGLRLSQSRPLYEGFKALREGEGWNSLTPAQQVGARGVGGSLLCSSWGVGSDRLGSVQQWKGGQ